MQTQSYISNTDTNYIDQLYEQYQQDKDSIDFGWQKFFEGFDLGTGKSLQEGNLEVSDDMLKEINVLIKHNWFPFKNHFFNLFNPFKS